MYDHPYEAVAARITASKHSLLFQIALIFLVPIILVRLNIIPIALHTIFLIGAAVVLVGILIKDRWNAEMLGMGMFKKRYVLAYLIFTTVGIVTISQMGELVGKEELARWWGHAHFMYLFFVVSLFQEVAYRGYLIPALGKLMHAPILIIITNALFFTFLHIIFPNVLINLPLAFVGGIGFAYMYIRFPSLPLIILSHAALNFVAVLYGFFIIPGVTY